MKSRLTNNTWHKATTHVSTFRLLCCDCGLVHNVKIKRKGKSLLFKISRNQHSTGQYRRWRNFPQSNTELVNALERLCATLAHVPANNEITTAYLEGPGKAAIEIAAAALNVH